VDVDSGEVHESEDLPARGDVIGGRYEIRDQLGRGATGVVYEAAHTLTGQIVALKWLRPDLSSGDSATARFLREARAACKIDHPNVVAVFDAGHERGTLFLVMERLRGEPFTAFIARGPHRPELVVATLMPALRGVAAAHEHGIVHRDLKPDNVFLCEPRRGWPGCAKVLDFGISKLKGPADGRELTQAGTFLGSPLYMAPEQIRNPTEVDARADVYSIGVMMYEAIAGRVPFDASSLPDLFRIVMSEEPRPLRSLREEVPRALDEIVLRAMARERIDRHADVRALAHDLEAFSGGLRFEEEISSVTARWSPPSPLPLDGSPTVVVIDSASSDTDPRLHVELPSIKTQVSFALQPPNPFDAETTVDAGPETTFEDHPLPDAELAEAETVALPGSGSQAVAGPPPPSVPPSEAPAPASPRPARLIGYALIALALLLLGLSIGRAL
jgi:serine/threonine protein kinase